MINIKEVTDDLFKGKHNILINPVNVLGFMGALAGKFEDKYPEIKVPYETACNDGSLRIGTVQALQTKSGIIVINTPTVDMHDIKTIIFTKPDGKTSTKTEILDPDKTLMDTYSVVNHSLKALRDYLWFFNGQPNISVGIPALGCGIGGANWEDVLALINYWLGDIDIDIYVYPPKPTTKLGKYKDKGDINLWSNDSYVYDDSKNWCKVCFQDLDKCKCVKLNVKCIFCKSGEMVEHNNYSLCQSCGL